MKRFFSKAILFGGVGALLFACAVQKPMPVFQPEDLNPKLQSGTYAQKVDNFLIVFDASGSMAGSYKGMTKLGWAKETVGRMNQTLPDLKVIGGLRRFGEGAFVQRESTALIYGLKDYEKAGLERALDTMTNGNGDSPLDRALEAASGDLGTTRGNIAVIVVSDGNEMDHAAALRAAKAMKAKYRGRLCIYTVVIGDDPEGKRLMEQIAETGECGFSVSAEGIASSADMAGFVEKVFLAKTVAKPAVSAVRPGDSDGDGVTDDLDQCPGTPKGAVVDTKGCPLDTDGDGVYDGLDQCPGTPKGAKVDAKGCPVDTDGDGVYDYRDQCPGTPKGARVDERGCWVLSGVYFDTAKWDIKPASYAVLDEVISVLKKNPEVKVEIQGHTDNRGSSAYNQKLSERRAKSVMEYLVKNGIAAGRLSYEGYGPSRPVASNATPEGQAKNRRVELKPVL